MHDIVRLLQSQFLGTSPSALQEVRDGTESCRRERLHDCAEQSKKTDELAVKRATRPLLKRELELLWILEWHRLHPHRARTFAEQALHRAIQEP